MFIQSGIQANKKCLLLKNTNMKEVRPFCSDRFNLFGYTEVYIFSHILANC